MMDAQLIGLDGGIGTMPTVDLYVPPAATGSHIVPIITGDKEAQQQADMAGFILKNGVKQMSNAGVDTIGFLARKVDFGDLNAQILQALADAGRTDYVPDYDIVDNGLTVKMNKQEGLS